MALIFGGMVICRGRICSGSQIPLEIRHGAQLVFFSFVNITLFLFVGQINNF